MDFWYYIIKYFYLYYIITGAVGVITIVMGILIIKEKLLKRGRVVKHDKNKKNR